jgi:cobalamin synthase
MQALRHYLLAVQFFTRIPVTGRLADVGGLQPGHAARQRGAFSGHWLAGGGLSAPCMPRCTKGLAPNPLASLVAAVLCTIATVLMTGGFHEDGLADVADGLGGSYDRERALDIMKDSRIGAFGAMALVLALLAKLSACWRCWARTACSRRWRRWWAGMCCRGCGRCSSCAACRMWATPPDPKASRWPTRSRGAALAACCCGVFCL